MLAIVSPHTWRSLEIAKDGWLLFYMYSFVILVFAALAAALAAVDNLIVTSLGAMGVVVLAFLYARLLGRLMWYASQQEAKIEERASRRAAAAERYSRIGQTPPPSLPSEQSPRQSRASTGASG